MKDEAYIRASDVGTFLFCKRAWHLTQLGSASSLEPERARGAAFHERHGNRVRAASRAGTLARWCAAAALTLFVIGLWMLAR